MQCVMGHFTSYSASCVGGLFSGLC